MLQEVGQIDPLDELFTGRELSSPGRRVYSIVRAHRAGIGWLRVNLTNQEHIAAAKMLGADTSTPIATGQLNVRPTTLPRLLRRINASWLPIYE